MDQNLLMILDAFPSCGDCVQALYETNSAFRSMCQDYVDAHIALQSWQQSSKAEATLRIEEYHTLIGELSEDIDAWIAMSGKYIRHDSQPDDS